MRTESSKIEQLQRIAWEPPEAKQEAREWTQKAREVERELEKKVQLYAAHLQKEVQAI